MLTLARNSGESIDLETQNGTRRMTVLSTGPKFCIAKIEGESGHHQLRVDEEYTLDVCGHRVGVTLIPRPGAARLAFDLARDVFAFRAELPEPARAAMRGKCRK